jgi:hypothetical protein
MNAFRRRRRPNIAGNDEVSLATVILALTAGGLLTLTTGLAAMLELEQFGPSVGGIIAFRADSAPTERWSVYVTVASRPGLPGSADGNSCILTPSVMMAAGGSLVVEARRLSRPPVYRVHWAGGHTAAGPGDCGTVADLVVQRTELMRLANVAGGFNSGLRLIGP